MTQRTATRLAAGLWIVSVASAGVGMIFLLLTLAVSVEGVYGFRGFQFPLVLVLASTGALIAARQPANPIGWLLLVGSVAGGIQGFGEQYTVLSAAKHAGTLPLTDLLAWLQNWIWVLIVACIGQYLLALFPDGRPLSPRWRILTWTTTLGLVIFGAGNAFTPGHLQALPPGVNNPYAISKAAADGLVSIGGLLFMGSLVGAAVSLIKRFRRSTGEVHEQMKWLVFAAGLMAVAFVAILPVELIAGAQALNEESMTTTVAEILSLVAIMGVPVATGIAIMKYRLYDIDVVINKAVIFGALAVAISVIYVAIVVGIGAAVGTRGESGVGLSVAATAVVALAFQPLRSWAGRVANRFVFGRRATPHEILTVLGERMSESYSLDEVLPRLAALVTEATAASRAEVWVRVGGEFRPAGSWPHDLPPGAALAASDGDSPPIPGAERVYAVRHQGEMLGALAVSAPANEPLTSADERLLADIASHAGLLLRNVKLIEELRASRQRLVAAQDLERRRIERDLHDGAQQHLVAMSVNLRLTQTLFDGDPPQAKEMLAQLQSDASEALENLRDLARGIYPPLLADRGLAAALASQAQKAPIPVKVECADIPRFPMEVESAIYFCVLEALQNVAKYARASRATLRVSSAGGRLEFSVTDDGAGFDPARTTRGSGTTNMTDRLEALGGRLEVRSAPGSGTTVSGWVPAAPAGSS